MLWLGGDNECGVLLPVAGTRTRRDKNRLLSPKIPLDSKVRTDAISFADKGRVQDEGT